MDLIGLPTTGSISLTAPAGEKLGGLNVRYFNRWGMMLPTPGVGMGGPHWGLLQISFLYVLLCVSSTVGEGRISLLMKTIYSLMENISSLSQTLLF